VADDAALAALTEDVRSLTVCVQALADRIDTFENEREAVSELPERLVEFREDFREAIGDVRQLVYDFRTACEDRFDAITQARKNGDGYEAKAGRIDFKTWTLFMSSVVIPVIVVLIANAK
jgi:predicted  nucleic acid-binding Zn-ribbon protein